VHAQVPAVALPETQAPAPSPDLVVLSHLRWTWVWQRPQHLVSRLAAARRASGARTWFVEEPVFADVTEPLLRQQALDGVTRVWLEIPRRGDLSTLPGFDDRAAGRYGELLRSHLSEVGRPHHPDVWLYTSRNAWTRVASSTTSWTTSPPSPRRRRVCICGNDGR
jgi:hypothetical protein